MPPQEQVSITFGHPEFWPEVAKTFPEFFARAGRIQQAVVSVTDRAYEALDSNQHILLNILMLEAVGMAEALTLIGNGMGHGAMKIVSHIATAKFQAMSFQQVSIWLRK